MSILNSLIFSGVRASGLAVILEIPYSRLINKWRATIFVLQFCSGIKIDFLQALISMITIKAIARS